MQNMDGFKKYLGLRSIRPFQKAVETPSSCRNMTRVAEANISRLFELLSIAQPARVASSQAVTNEQTEICPEITELDPSESQSVTNEQTETRSEITALSPSESAVPRPTSDWASPCLTSNLDLPFQSGSLDLPRTASECPDEMRADSCVPSETLGDCTVCARVQGFAAPFTDALNSDSLETDESIEKAMLEIYLLSTQCAGNELDRKALNIYDAVHQSSSSSILFTRFGPKMFAGIHPII
jgi:hypothetical protein